MRGARWLLLAAMLIIVSAVGVTYRVQKKIIHDQAPPKPKPLPPELNFSADSYHYHRTDNNNRPKADISARSFRQVKDSSRVDLTGLELKLYHKTGDSFDLVKSDAATLFANENRLYSEGDVEITLGIPAENEPPPNLISIRSSGVSFDIETGKAETDRPSQFTFRNGDGTATGAVYDPGQHELQMKKDVEIHWTHPGDHAKPMKIEANTLYYKEAASEIWLKPWGRMTRENTVVEGYDTVIHLQDKAIRQIETNRAHGTDDYPNRKLKYAAEGLWVDLDDYGEVAKIRGVGNAQVTSTNDASETAIAASQVEMFFNDGEEGSTLSHVNAIGNGVVTAKPLPAAGRQIGETHVLHSENIDLNMRSGGREIEKLVTHAPGRLEFLPNLPVQRKRTLDGKDMVIAYGPQNRIESFRAQDVHTQTDPASEERQRNPATTLTASREMLARFEPKSSQLASIEQWGDFTYESGGRRARASKATLDSDQNVMVLDTGARVWDPSGATAADRIRLDERTGNFVAEGRVSSSRMPESGRKDTGMLNGDEPLEARARKMESTNRNRTIHYEGDVSLWQGANRIQGNTVDVDREKQTLVADGNVVTNLWETPKEDEKKKTANPVLTTVRAPHLVYTDRDRLASYSGGVLLTRTGLQVKSRELRAYLAESDADSRLEKAYAEGSVEIVQSAKERTRTGFADHGEYYPGEQKVVLRGGQPRLLDSLKGATSGAELTYFANDDRVVASGSGDQPAKSRIQRK
jgi:lipopolysaccharide export system protein LptA